jgi:uncharacterized coiled-coil protein SlyX
MPTMPDFRAPRVRMPRISLRGRSRGAAGEPTASKAKTAEQAKPTNGKTAETKEAATPAAKAATGTKSAATKAAAGSTPEPNLEERMKGLQGWMAEIERKQGRLTYFGLAAVTIAILAAGAALYFGLSAKSDSATKGDLDALSKRIDDLEAAATKNSKDTQAALNASVAQLQQTISSLQKQQSQDSANIATLQSQASAGAFGKGAGAAAGTGAGTGLGTGVTPGATTTTPSGK